MIEHIQANTYHTRHGSLNNAFHYGVDFVLSDLQQDGPKLLSYNRFNLWSLRDKNHGGLPKEGQGLAWFKQVLLERDFDLTNAKLYLLTQPGFLWFQFNPVSFWIAMRDDKSVVIVAEVSNTFGHRHCYFCAHPDFKPLVKADTIIAEKIMHVSPFQTVTGNYFFNFDITPKYISIRINYKSGEEGVLATLTGKRRKATNTSLLFAALRRPMGALRVVALIHWQAVILYFKRAPFLKKPPPPNSIITDSKTYKGTSI